MHGSLPLYSGTRETNAEETRGREVPGDSPAQVVGFPWFAYTSVFIATGGSEMNTARTLLGTFLAALVVTSVTVAQALRVEAAPNGSPVRFSIARAMLASRPGAGLRSIPVIWLLSG